MGDGHALMQFIIRPDLIDCRELTFPYRTNGEVGSYVAFLLI